MRNNFRTIPDARSRSINKVCSEIFPAEVAGLILESEDRLTRTSPPFPLLLSYRRSSRIRKCANMLSREKCKLDPLSSTANASRVALFIAPMHPLAIGRLFRKLSHRVSARLLRRRRENRGKRKSSADNGRFIRKDDADGEFEQTLIQLCRFAGSVPSRLSVITLESPPPRKAKYKSKSTVLI